MRPPSQSPAKLIENESTESPADPLKVISITADGKPVKFNEKFAAKEDWLRGLTLELKNISEKEITYIHCDLDFPETASTGQMMAYQLTMGLWPGIDNKSRAPFSLTPGSEVDIAFDDKRYADVARFINTRQPITSINRVTLRISFIIFADGTGYGGGGTLFRQDSNNPRRFTPVH